MSSRKAAIIFGLGHIGTSLAARLVKRGWSIEGWDGNPKAVRFCESKRLISSKEVRARIAVVALPESAVGDRAFKKKLAQLEPGALVTDVFSSKGPGVRELERFCHKHGLRYGWSHPLAGREGQGAASFDASIFDKASVLIDSQAKGDVRRELGAFWREAGCKVFEVSTKAHQRQMAAGSHLMHALAFSLVHTLKDQLSVSPSVRGTTRVAKSSPEAWATILSSNKKELRASIARLSKELARVSRLIGQEDNRALARYLREAHEKRMQWENES